MFRARTKERRTMKLTEKMEEFMNNLIGERMEQVYQEKDGRKYDVFNEELELAHQNVLRKLPKEQEKILFDYATEVANRCSDMNEFYYRMGLRDGLMLKDVIQTMLDALMEQNGMLSVTVRWLIENVNLFQEHYREYDTGPLCPVP